MLNFHNETILLDTLEAEKALNICKINRIIIKILLGTCILLLALSSTSLSESLSQGMKVRWPVDTASRALVGCTDIPFTASDKNCKIIMK